MGRVILVYSRSFSAPLPKSEELEGVYSTIITENRALQIAHEHVEKVANGINEPLFMYLAFQVGHADGLGWDEMRWPVV